MISHGWPGLLSAYGQNPTAAVVIDDVPIGSSSGLQNGMLNPIDIDPSDLARIEVLKGPQGTLYGADSLGGLVKYVTVDPSTASRTGRAEVSGIDVPGGEVGYSVRGAVNVPLSDVLALRVSGFTRRDPGYVNNALSGQNNVDSANVSGGRAAALWRLMDNVSLKVSALIQQTDGNGFPYFNAQLSPNGTLQPTLGYLNFTAVPGSGAYSTQQQLYSARLDAKVAGLDLVSVTGYSIDKYSGKTDFGTGLGPYFVSPVNLNVVDLLSDLHYTTDKFSQELRVSSSVGPWLDWLVGGFYTHEKAPVGTSHDSLYNVDPATGTLGDAVFTTVTSPYTFSEEAIFADFTVHFTDRISVQLGGRESWNSQTYQQMETGAGVIDFYGQPSPYAEPTLHATGNAFTYLVTPQFKISPDVMAYARFATGYRIGGPNSAGLIYPNTPTAYKPDATTNYEIGIKGNYLEHRLSVDLAAYYINWHDFQLKVLQGCYDGFVTNAGDAKSEGVELSVQARPARGLTITAQGSYNDAQLTQNLPPTAAYLYAVAGEQLPYSIRWSGGLTANQDIPFCDTWTGFVGGGLTYVGSRYGDFASSATSPRAQIPGYTTLNLYTGVRHESWLVNLFINNAADKRGIVGIAAGELQIGNPGGYYGTVIPPRTVGLSVARNF